MGKSNYSCRCLKDKIKNIDKEGNLKILILNHQI